MITIKYQNLTDEVYQKTILGIYFEKEKMCDIIYFFNNKNIKKKLTVSHINHAFKRSYDTIG